MTYHLISAVELSSTTSVVEFADISDEGIMLECRVNAKSTRTTQSDQIAFKTIYGTQNGWSGGMAVADTGGWVNSNSNYYWGGGSAYFSSTVYSNIAASGSTNNVSGQFSPVIMQFWNYNVDTQPTSAMLWSGTLNATNAAWSNNSVQFVWGNLLDYSGGSQFERLTKMSGLYIQCGFGDFVAGSSFRLYGYKAA